MSKNDLIITIFEDVVKLVTSDEDELGLASIIVVERKDEIMSTISDMLDNMLKSKKLENIDDLSEEQLAHSRRYFSYFMYLSVMKASTKDMSIMDCFREVAYEAMGIGEGK